MQQFSAKEKFLLTNTLNCVPVMLQGHAVLIDLLNEQSVAGRIESADGQMNIQLTEAVLIDRDGRQHPFEKFMVRERIIRQIHMPDYMSMRQELKQWSEYGFLSYKPRKPQSRKPTFKQRRAEQRHKEIVEQIAQKK